MKKLNFNPDCLIKSCSGGLIIEGGRRNTPCRHCNPDRPAIKLSKSFQSVMNRLHKLKTENCKAIVAYLIFQAARDETITLTEMGHIIRVGLSRLEQLHPSV